MRDLPLLLPLIIIVALFLLSQRTRRKAALQEAEQQRALGPGARVMTTSGLYGTIVALDDEETARLAIAPGVEVTWARAALRPASSPAESSPAEYSPPERLPGEPSTERADAAEKPA